MRIVSFGQVVDLDQGGVFTNQFTVELADGRRVAIDTSESTVEALIQLAAGIVVSRAPRQSQRIERPADPQEFQRPPAEPEEMPEEELAAIFGGDPDPGEVPPDAEPIMGKVAEDPLPVRTGNGGLGGGVPVPVRPRVDKDGFVLPTPSRTVDRDEMGYPIVERRSAAPSGDDGVDDGTQI